MLILSPRSIYYNQKWFRINAASLLRVFLTAQLTVYLTLFPVCYDVFPHTEATKSQIVVIDW